MQESIMRSLSAVFYPQARQQPSAHPRPNAPHSPPMQHHHQDHPTAGGIETRARIPPQRKSKLCTNRLQLIYDQLYYWDALAHKNIPFLPRTDKAKSTNGVCM